jgi:acetyl-CoA carboxylase biotin carboxylase subunit
VAAGFEVPVHYDSMVAKVIAHAADRRLAIDRMDRALAEYEIGGVPTTVPMFRWLLRQDDFVAARFDTTFLDRVLAGRNGSSFLDPPDDAEELAVIAAALSVTLGRPAVGAATVGAGSDGRWKQAARVEGLR